MRAGTVPMETGLPRRRRATAWPSLVPLRRGPLIVTFVETYANRFLPPRAGFSSLKVRFPAKRPLKGALDSRFPLGRADTLGGGNVRWACL